MKIQDLTNLRLRIRSDNKVNAKDIEAFINVPLVQWLQSPRAKRVLEAIAKEYGVSPSGSVNFSINPTSDSATVDVWLTPNAAMCYACKNPIFQADMITMALGEIKNQNPVYRVDQLRDKYKFLGIERSQETQDHVPFWDVFIQALLYTKLEEFQNG